MNPHEWLADYIRDVDRLHEAMIGVGVLITVICFKCYVPEFAKDTELAVKGWIRLVIAAGLVSGFGSFAEITGEGFDGLATYINPNWQEGNTTTFEIVQRRIMAATGSNDLANSQGQKGSLNVFGKWAQKIADNVYAALITAFMTILTWLALAMMFFLEIAHTILLNAEYAVIPAFMGFIANPSTAHLAHGFLISFLSLQMWVPVYALVCRVNDSLMRGAFVGLYTGQQPVFSTLGNFSAAGAAAPLLGSFALFGFFALWVIFTLRMVPTIANKLVRGEGFSAGLAEGGVKAMEAATGRTGKAFKSGGKAAWGALEAMGGSGGSRGGGHGHSGSHSSKGGDSVPSAPSSMPSSPPLLLEDSSGPPPQSLSSSPSPKRLMGNNPYSAQNRQKTLETHQAKLLELNSRVMSDGSLELSL